MAEKVMDEVNAIVAEARKTKETAERMANGEAPPGEADDIRVLAGMVHQIAEQVERLAIVVSCDEAPFPHE
jgi:biotin synthase-like enzyme